MSPDIVVIGAGIVGAAIAYGLTGQRLRVLVLDGDDRDFRAASANFGLIWVQGKGLNMPRYQEVTRASSNIWPEFSAQLADASGIDVHYERRGGLALCLGEAALEKRQMTLLKLQQQSGVAERDWEMLDRVALAQLLPKVELGPEVTGASFGRLDGHVNPLRLLAALHAGIGRRGGELRRNSAVRTIVREAPNGFRIHTDSEQITTPRLVIAAGLGSRALGLQIALNIPVRPLRGQILVTERLETFLPLPISGLRQTREGTVTIGATHEDAGYDCSTTIEAAAKLSAEAIRRIPALRAVNLVRQWSGLRVMTPDSYPIYVQSSDYPGAFAAVCHSGVTLAALHATIVADAIAAGRLPTFLEDFHPRRFHVPQAA